MYVCEVCLKWYALDWKKRPINLTFYDHHQIEKNLSKSGHCDLKWRPSSCPVSGSNCLNNAYMKLGIILQSQLSLHFLIT